MIEIEALAPESMVAAHRFRARTRGGNEVLDDRYGDGIAVQRGFEAAAIPTRARLEPVALADAG